MNTKEHRPLVADRSARLHPEDLDALRESGIEEENGWLVYTGELEGDVDEALRAERELRDRQVL